MTVQVQKPVVLLIGATGLFGGLLARRLLGEGRVDLVCATRTADTLKTFCAEHGGRYIQLDREDEAAVSDALVVLQPFAVIDCSGPFQAYGDNPYGLAKAAIHAGAHYLDIADAVDFIRDFHNLNEQAKSKGVLALTGASTTPAITACIADDLTADMQEVLSITSALVPGNRAPRTLSVLRSVLSLVGQAFSVERFGETKRVRGWSETERFDLAVKGKPKVNGRLASLVEMPDNLFFNERYKAQQVAFKAGLEVKLFHYAIGAMGWLVSTGLMKSLTPLAKLVRWGAGWFEWMGTDEGGMKVSVLGKTHAGSYQRREWDLIADQGHGPNVPTVPVSIILNRLLDGKFKPGARVCMGEITSVEIDKALAGFDGKTQVHSLDIKPLFQTVLGGDFEKLPEPVQDLHSKLGKSVFEGRADIKGATGLLGRVGARLAGFPSGARDVPVRVTITADERSETWVREFGEKSFMSHLSLDSKGRAQERFDVLTARLGLAVQDGKLIYPVLKGRLFGLLPLPLFLLPESIAHETIDAEGRFFFDVLVRFRFGGRVAHYQGWLERKA